MTSGTLLEGTRLGPYEVVAYLGRGGMGEVYRGRDRTLDRDVALKVLPRESLDDASFAGRFRREAQIWGRLDHPSIIPVYFAGIEEGFPFLAMKFVGGGSVADLVRDGPVPLDRGRAILAEVASALDYAHSLGIVHRDVKPANVLLGEDGRAQLSDFGIARVVAEGHAAATGGIVGTPSYMAPEQARSQQPDPRSDLYSLGCMAYEMFTGSPPFPGGTPLEVMMRHISELPLPPRSLAPSLPLHVERAILKAMSKEPGERWPSAGLFVEALRGRLDVESVLTISLPGHAAHPATPSPGPTEPGTAARRRAPRLLLAALLGLVLGSALFAGLRWSLVSRLPRPKPEPVDSLLTTVERFMDQGAYAEALGVAEQALRLRPDHAGARALRDRVRRAWEAEKSLELWPEPPAPSPH